MKKTTKWLTLVLSLILTTNSAVVYGAGDAPLPATTEETATIVADDEATLEPEVGEEIVEWREEGVRHYYLGDGVYQAIVSARSETGGEATASTNYNGSVFLDTYISSTNPTGTSGNSTQLNISSNHTPFIKFDMPELPDNAFIERAELHFWHKSTATSGTVNVMAYMVNFPWDEASLNYRTASSHANLGMDTYSYGGTGLSAGTTPKHATIVVTNAVERWASGAKYNYGLALKRVGGSNSSAIIMSSEAASAYRPYAVIRYNLVDVPIQNGTYYIHNYVEEIETGTPDGFKYFMQANNSDLPDADGNLSGISYCEMLPLSSGTSQEWVVEYLHNGYYTIRKVGESQVLAVQEGKENMTNQAIVREPFTGDYRQQWKFIPTVRGSFKVIPRSAEAYETDWVMGVRTYMGPGENVIQLAYSNDSDYKDELCLRKVGDDVSLLAITANDDIMFSGFMGILKTTGEMGYNSFNVQRKEVFTKTEIMDRMEASTIFVSISHGCYNSSDSGIYTTGDKRFPLWGSDIEEENLNFQNCRLMIFAACNTAKTSSGICSAVVSAGAEYAIGFEESIRPLDANRWVEIFFRYYSQGIDIESCATYANTHQIRKADGTYESPYTDIDTITSSTVFS